MMVTVSGRLLDFVRNPSRVAQVQVRAKRVSPHGDGLMTEAPVTVEFDEATGMVMFSAAAETIGMISWVTRGQTGSQSHADGGLPLIIPDKGSATLRECVDAALLSEGSSLTDLQRLAQEVAGMVATLGNLTQIEEWAEEVRQIAAGLADRVQVEVAEYIGSTSVVQDAARAAVDPVAREVVTELTEGLIWDKGNIPSSVQSLDELEDGAHGVPNTSTRQRLGIPGDSTGSLELFSIGAVRTALFINAYRGMYHASQINGVWSDWSEIVNQEHVDNLRDDISRGTGEQWLTHADVDRIDDLPAGTYNVGYGSLAEALGMPSRIGGTLERTWLNSNNTGGIDTYRVAANGPFRQWARYYSGGSWGEWLPDLGQALVAERERTIPAGTDWDTLTDEGVWAAPVTGRNYTGTPYENPVGKLFVSDMRNSTGNIRTQMFVSYTPNRIWIRERNTSGTWSTWAEVSMDGTDRIQAGAARREAVVEAGLRRRGGVIGTGGKPAITLRFDHHLIYFGEKVLPLLKQYRLPWGQMINPGGMGTGNDDWTWDQLAQASHESGGEVWNHGYRHSNVVNISQADTAVTRSLRELRENLPTLWIDSWSPPGQPEYLGFTTRDTPEQFYDTYMGKLVLAQHAFAHGQYPGADHPLTGRNIIGQGYFALDRQTPSWVERAINLTRDSGRGATFMLHANRLDTDGYMTTTEFEQVIAYVAALRDAGEIVVLSNSGILMADKSVPARAGNMLVDAGAGEVDGEWSQVVSTRTTAPHLGVAHEAEVWVAGAGDATLRVEVTSPTYPVTVEHSVDLVAGEPQRMSVVATPPLDTTRIAVTLTGSVRHTGINYRPI